MSDLQRRWARGKMNGAMDIDSFNELDELDQEDENGPLPELPEFVDDDSSSASSASSTGTIVPSPSRNLFARPQGVPRGRTLEQIPWTTYFERELFLPGDGIIYHAYLTSPVGKGPLFVMHHGAGSSGLSFAVLSAEIRKRLPTAGVLSPDCRGHGSTTGAPTTSPLSPSHEPPDLSLPTLTADLHAVLRLTQAAMHWHELPPLLLVGHSLGGAVVTSFAFAAGGTGPTTTPSPSPIPPVLGFAVLDVVEGSAMDALQSMQTYLSTRPAGFASLQAGIDWHVRSRTIRNSVSARTSVPALLALRDPVEGGGEGAGAGAGAATARPWRWRTDLGATQPFWEGWFVGLSRRFLEAKGGKLLLLAGTDRLDTELTIGQMQGKYNLQVFPEAGHFIHEDLPEKTAVALVDFHKRNDRGSLVLPPKVSELLAQGKKV